ncbi:MotA/TolQ/ExbB proton channel family protein [Tistrella mobilis]|jgi:biopolymer transport protein ExbB|uniref:MotA/TolQ/ExbB proton channel family protein n=1 Tax=Tistrella mobilis TaxID=171437 RepID=UPI0035564995
MTGEPITPETAAPGDAAAAVPVTPATAVGSDPGSSAPVAMQAADPVPTTITAVPASVPAVASASAVDGGAPAAAAPVVPVQAGPTEVTQAPAAPAVANPAPVVPAPIAPTSTNPISAGQTSAAPTPATPTSAAPAAEAAPAATAVPGADATATGAGPAPASEAVTALPGMTQPGDTVATTEADGGTGSSTLDLLIAGGPIVGVLGVLSVIATAIILLKIWHFLSAGLGNGRKLARAVDRAVREGPEAGRAALDGVNHPGTDVIRTVLDGRLHGVPEPALREEAERIGLERVESLRSHLRALELMGGIAPLLGLLGTVLGMITVFQTLETAGSAVDPSQLSGGIWEALLTTAVGLIVAIPCVVAHAWLDRRVERAAHVIEDSATRLFVSRDMVRHAGEARRPAAIHGGAMTPDLRTTARAAGPSA